MVSTYHSADTQTFSNKGKETEKPLWVIYYNRYMGGVDLKGQLLHMEKMTKLYLKLFKRLLNYTFLNSFVV